MEHLQEHVCASHIPLQVWGGRFWGHISGSGARPVPQSPATLLVQTSLFFSSPHRGELLHLWGSGSLQSFQAVNSTSGFLLISNILMSSGNAMSSL